MNQRNNFFAILKDGEIRKINLTQKIIPQIRKVFIDNSKYLFQETFEQIEFDGSYSVLGKEEEVLYVNFRLPDEIQKAVTNPIGQINLNLINDEIKALFWYENSTYYFQGFDKRKLLRNRNVLFYDRNTFDQLKHEAFVIDNIVSGMFQNGKFYFRSYANANKIFSLIEFFQEATNEVLIDFSNNANIAIDNNWLKANANTLMRKHIALIQKSGILANANTGKIKKSAKKFSLTIELEDDKIKFPSNVQDCKDILYFLNEQYYIGLITGRKYRTNSKKSIEKSIHNGSGKKVNKLGSRNQVLGK